jgi:drug/metabolite transporter (DMT)-like permease
VTRPLAQPTPTGTSTALSTTTPSPARIRPRWVAYAALALAVGAIAWVPLLIRWAAIPGPASAFYRVLIAAVVLVPWLLVRPASRRPTRRAALIAFGGGVCFGLDLALYNTAVLRTSAATAAFLGNNTPVFVGLGAWWLLRRRPPGAFWAGLALALSGGAVMILADVWGHSVVGDPIGDVLALIAGMFFAGYLLSAEYLRSDMDTLTFNTIAILGSVVTLLGVCLAMGLPLSGYTLETWAALAGLGLVSQLAAYFALVYALGHLPATITSVGLLTQLPLTAILAMLFLREPITSAQAGGGLLVLAGVWVVNRRTP